MANCLAGCIKDYASGTIFTQAPFEIQPQNVAPVIKASIESSGLEITVGNESYPFRPHKACIKSIEFGFISQATGSMEIIDEEGGSFSFFVDALLKCSKNQVDLNMKFQIGWVYSNCGFYSNNNIVLSPEITSTIISIDSNISNGIVRYIINFSSIAPVVQNLRENKTFGEQVGGKKLGLNEAIQQLAAIEPAITVRSARYNQSGELEYLRDGHEWRPVVKPKDSWQADSMNKYAVISKWVEPFTIEDGKEGKGVIILHDPTNPNTLILLQDPADEDGSSSVKTLGTFIVNGGKCSNVLEFSPKLNFLNSISNAATGGATNPFGTDNELKKDEKEHSDVDSAGPQQTITLTQQAQSIMGKDAVKNTNKSQNKHSKAARMVDINFKTDIEAELRIVGTTLADFYTIANGRPVSIVVVNPFHIVKENSGCDFLKKSSCHPVFSSKKWMVKGINHSVREGSFVTILKVYLVEGPVKLKNNCY